MDPLEEELTAMRELEPWWTASIDGMSDVLRGWSSEAVLRLFMATVRVLTERGEWGTALTEVARSESQAGSNQQREQELESRRMNAAELPQGCLLGTAIGTLGLLALLVVGVAILLVIGWRLIRGDIR